MNKTPALLLVATLSACATTLQTSSTAPSAVQETAVAPVSFTAAKRELVNALATVQRGKCRCHNVDDFVAQDPITNVVIARDHFAFTDRGVVAARFSTTGKTQEYSVVRTFYYRDNPAVSIKSKNGGVYVELSGTRIPAAKDVMGDTPVNSFHFGPYEDAMAFVKALQDVMRASDPARLAADEANFRYRAEQWAAMNPKPPLSDEANRHRVIAESAVREKNFDLAAEHLQAALETDPTWSTGNYNLALVLGETGDYAEAARYMRRFLLLEPNSREAQAARDKIIVWEDKAAHASP